LEEAKMMHVTAQVPTLQAMGLLVALFPVLFACSGEGAKYSGTWKRDLYGEGEVHMKLASNGGMELMLPSPRWPDSVDVKARAAFLGDTLVFKADTAAIACQTADARYVISRTEDQLHIVGLGGDNCGGRRAALVGTWQKS
jgi:hypothetical protein